MTNKYATGKIYKIESDQSTKCYVGSSYQPLSHRMANHRYDYKRYKEGKHNYVTSFELLKYDDAKIYLVENYPCNSKEELEARERYWIKESDCVNKCQPGRTDKEYREDNKEIIKQKDKEYREANKEVINQKIRDYKQANKATIKQKSHDYNIQRVTCECGAEVSKKCLTRHKTRSLHTENMAKLNTPTA